MNDYEIPKRLQVGGQVINVEVKEKLEDNLLGRACLTQGLIEISNTTAIKGERITCSPTSKYQTLWHEIIHCILDNMGEDELSSNEKFVNIFACMLTEAITSFDYNDAVSLEEAAKMLE